MKVILGIMLSVLFVLSSCALEGIIGGNVTPIGEVLKAIEENGWIVFDTNMPPSEAQTFTVRGVVTYFYKYYAYIVDEDNDGIKLYLKNGDFRDLLESGKLIEVTGIAYARDFGDAKEYRLYVSKLDDVKVLEDGTLPEPLEIQDGKSLTLSEYGKYVVLDATYEGKDEHDNYIFDNGGAQVIVYKYSKMPSDLNVGSNYELKGVVGQNYGYVLFIWDPSLVTEK